MYRPKKKSIEEYTDEKNVRVKLYCNVDAYHDIVYFSMFIIFYNREEIGVHYTYNMRS